MQRLNNDALHSGYNTYDIDQKGKVIVEYIWIGGDGDDIRSKCKTYDHPITSCESLSEWNYDGSSTKQATTDSSEILLKPVALFDDPFRGAPNKLVLCETYNADGTPTISNFRHLAAKIFEQDDEKNDPWFGIEQEYTILQRLGTDITWPLGFPMGGYPRPQGPYYCGVGAGKCFGRVIADLHYKLCLNAGIKIYGTNAEVMPGQWEFQIGTCKGIEIADHLWIARFILMKVSEEYGVDVTFEPKPIKGDWNGSGCHTNYSTNDTRNDIDMKNISSHMEKLKKTHNRLIKLYGENNEMRLTGRHETSSMSTFSYGVADRGSSIRIPRTTEKSGKGYYEDRRPASNIDPYVVCSMLYSATCLNGNFIEEMEDHYKSYLENKKK